jgi:hypothetical protein
VIDKHQDAAESFPALIKLFWVWLWVGVSQMTPLQAVQFLAACVAIVYSVIQIYLLIRDKIIRDRGEPS